MAEDLVGKTLGQYQIQSVLGRGGMANVYRAYQPSMDREVAIKVITGQIADREDFVMRFEREARMIAKLQHPHILPVYDFDPKSNPVYMVMQLIKGSSLDVRLRKEPLPIDQAVRIFSQVASALDYAHQRGIVHRDLKPNNILLDENSNPYLMDFGIAKMVEGGTRLTASGILVGTPTYMAPEQWRAEDVDARTDIYALGIMLFEMLTGNLPFKGDTPFSLMYQHMDTPMPSPRLLTPELPDAMNLVITKATAKRKEERYSSAMEFANDVNAALLGKPTLAEQQPPTSSGQTRVPSLQTPVDLQGVTSPGINLSSRPGQPSQPTPPPGQVLDLPPKPKGLPAASTGSNRTSLLLVGAAILVALLAGGIGFFAVISSRTPTSTSVAVLPSLTATAPPTASYSVAPTLTSVPTLAASATSVSIAAATSGQTFTALPATNTATLVLPSSSPTAIPATSTRQPPSATSTPPPTSTATTEPSQTSVPQQPTVPPTVPAATLVPPALTPAATPGGPGFDLVIFRSGEVLTLYMQGDGSPNATVSLAGLSIESEDSNGQRLKTNLAKYPAFAGLQFDKLPTPTCFHFKTRQSNAPLPLECRQIPNNNLFTQTLTAANTIWYDNAASEPRPVFIMRGADQIGQCPPTSTECTIFVPLAGDK